MEKPRGPRGLIESKEGSLDLEASPYLRVDDDLHRVRILGFDEVNKVEGPKMIADDPSVGQKVVVFTDASFRLKPGQGFEERIIWAKEASQK